MNFEKLFINNPLISGATRIILTATNEQNEKDFKQISISSKRFRLNLFLLGYIRLLEDIPKDWQTIHFQISDDNENYYEKWTSFEWNEKNPDGNEYFNDLLKNVKKQQDKNRKI